MLKYSFKIFIVLFFLFSLFSCSTARKEQKGGRTYKYRKSGIRSSRKMIRRSNQKTTGKLDELIEKYWGAKYKFGAVGPSKFDCSGFVQRIFKEAYSVKLPRSSKKQYKTGIYVSRNRLKYGDLVFFNTNGRGVSHVGVYIGNGKFSHASSSKGVTISSLENPYYKKRYIGARRVL